MKRKYRTLCIIPARGGSKRIPGKNIKPFMGKPMIAYSIEQVKRSEIADIVMVSTDDKKTADISTAYGAEVPFYRSASTSNDTAGIADVLIEVVNEYKKQEVEFEYIACVLATAPLLNADHLGRAFDILKTREAAEAICSVQAFSYPPQRGLILADGELAMKHPENYYVRSQDCETIYHDCGQFFIFRTKALLRDKKLYVQHTVPYLISELESQDIDSEDDWKLAELKYKTLYGEN